MMERGEQSKEPRKAINPRLAMERAREFLKSFDGMKPAQKIEMLSLHNQTITRPGTNEVLPCIVSEGAERAKGKPTVVILPGIFREAKEMAIDLATIATVFDAHVVVVDFASLAQNKGMQGILSELPALLEATEADKNPPPPRIFIGESLGGIVAQAVVAASEDDPELQRRLNIKHLVLSHTIPPAMIDRRVELFARFLRLFGSHFPMPIARRIITAFTERAQRIHRHEDAQSFIDLEWSAVQDILRKERSLTGRRGFGYTQSALGAIDEGRKHKGHPSQVPTSVILSTTDRLFKTISQETWETYHENVTVTELNGPHGHHASGLKETYLTNLLVPMLADILPVATQ